SIKKIEVSPEAIVDIQNLKKYYQNNIVFETQINRKTLDPENKFKYLIFYPGNFPSLRFKKYSGFSSNSAFLQFLLERIPNDCAIVYSKHSLDKSENDHYINHNERIIDIDKLSSIDNDISIRILPYVDAVVNVYSNIYMPAMLLGKPIFSYGNSPNAKFSINTIDHIYDYLSTNVTLPSN
ncbi:capsule biosynthesis protein CapA, partial [Escherichia coli]|nr:capsule biosynthesis protein CapA [Escherichia coli]